MVGQVHEMMGRTDAPARPDIDVQHVLAGRQVYRAMHAAITTYVENNKQPTLVLLQSHWPVRRLVQQVAILNDFPVGMLTASSLCPSLYTH